MDISDLLAPMLEHFMRTAHNVPVHRAKEIIPGENSPLSGQSEKKLINSTFPFSLIDDGDSPVDKKVNIPHCPHHCSYSDAPSICTIRQGKIPFVC